MKILLLILSFILPLSITSSNVDKKQNEFLEEVEYNYVCYNIFDSIDTNEYSILIVKGIYNIKAAYGISFISIEEGEYHCVLESSSESYLLTEKGISAKCLALDASTSYILRIYNKDNKEVKTSDRIVLNKFSPTDYDKSASDVVNGLGKGMVFTSLVPYKTNLPFFKVLIYVMSGIIVIISIIIIVMAINKRGMFNAEKRKEGVIKMRDLLEQDTNDLKETDLFKDYVPIEEKNVEVIPESQKYNKEDDSDELVSSKIADIKAYLHDLGFVTEYNSLDEDDKNKIMLELIKLKNEGSITLKAYYEETYQLWKK